MTMVMHRSATLNSVAIVVAALLLPCVAGGCGAGQKQASKNQDFFTSGNREADQRADQRMAKTQELRGSGGSGGDKTAAKVSTGGAAGGEKAEVARSLYQRLGEEKAMKAIVDDFVTRALADPRVNWARKGVIRGGFRFQRVKSMEWKADPAAVAQLKKHLVQFLSLSTGGPAFYDGLEMKQAHADLHITNAEFDAAVGDFKASLDNLAVGNKEQKELLAIIESTRPQIVQDR
jgi:hemoglobin